MMRLWEGLNVESDRLPYINFYIKSSTSPKALQHNRHTNGASESEYFTSVVSRFSNRMIIPALKVRTEASTLQTASDE